MQLLESALAGDRVQLAPGLKLPLPELEKETVPLGLEAPPPPVSVTVAVQVPAWFKTNREPQLTDVVVERRGVGVGAGVIVGTGVGVAVGEGTSVGVGVAVGRTVLHCRPKKGMKASKSGRSTWLFVFRSKRAL